MLCGLLIHPSRTSAHPRSPVRRLRLVVELVQHIHGTVVHLTGLLSISDTRAATWGCCRLTAIPLVSAMMKRRRIGDGSAVAVGGGGAPAAATAPELGVGDHVRQKGDGGVEGTVVCVGGNRKAVKKCEVSIALCGSDEFQTVLARELELVVEEADSPAWPSPPAPPSARGDHVVHLGDSSNRGTVVAITSSGPQADRRVHIVSEGGMTKDEKLSHFGVVGWGGDWAEPPPRPEEQFVATNLALSGEPDAFSLVLALHLKQPARFGAALFDEAEGAGAMRRVLTLLAETDKDERAELVPGSLQLALATRGSACVLRRCRTPYAVTRDGRLFGVGTAKRGWGNKEAGAVLLQ